MRHTGFESGLSRTAAGMAIGVRILLTSGFFLLTMVLLSSLEVISDNQIELERITEFAKSKR